MRIQQKVASYEKIGKQKIGLIDQANTTKVVHALLKAHNFY